MPPLAFARGGRWVAVAIALLPLLTPSCNGAPSAPPHAPPVPVPVPKTAPNAPVAPAAPGQTTWNVTNGGDMLPGESCPGTLCTLRAAWEASRMGDTIMLSTSVLLKGPLNKMPLPPTGHFVSTLTVVGGPGISVSPGTDGQFRFIGIIGYPWYNGRYVSLILKDLEIRGFTVSVVIENDNIVGPAICLSHNGWCQPNNYHPHYQPPTYPPPNPPHPPFPHPQPPQPFVPPTSPQAKPVGPQPPGHNLDSKADIMLLDDEEEGKYDYDFPMERDVTKPPPGRNMLELVNVRFVNNHAKSGSGSTAHLLGGTVFLYCTYGDCSVSMNEVIARLNTGEGRAIIGTFLYCTSGSSYRCTADLKRVTAEHNTASKPIPGVSPSRFSGGLVVVNGDLRVSDGTFQENTLGMGMGVLQSEHGDLFVNRTTISHNAPLDSIVPEKGAAALYGAHIHVQSSTFIVNSSIHNGVLVNAGPDDVYFSETSIYNSAGNGPPVVGGFVVYNRNPGNADLLNMTLGTPSFADCKQAKMWLPCHQGSQCQNVMSSSMDITGYRCL